jgi:hypothetical protein
MLLVYPLATDDHKAYDGRSFVVQELPPLDDIMDLLLFKDKDTASKSALINGVGVGVGDPTGTIDEVGVIVLVKVGVTVCVNVGVMVGVIDGVGVLLAVKLIVGVTVLVTVGVLVGVLVGVRVTLGALYD